MAANAARAAQGGSGGNSAQDFRGLSLAEITRKIRENNSTDASAGATSNGNALSQRASDVAARAAASTGVNNASAGASPGDINSGLFGAMRSAADPNQPQTPTGTTGGLMQGASAGMTSGVGVEDDFRSTTEERLTALESGGQVNGAQTNLNRLESGAPSNFIPQNQQEVVGAVVDGNKPSDRGIQQMMSKRNL